MRKILLTMSVVGLFTSANAQVNRPVAGSEPLRETVDASTLINIGNKSTNSKRDALGPVWFDVAESIRSNQGGATTGYSPVTLFRDTNALIAYSNAVQQPNINAVGTVFDPRSNIYAANNTFKTSKFNDYTVDSVRFTFLYRRFSKTYFGPDTIILTTFDRTTMSRQFTDSAFYFGVVDYSSKNLTAGPTGAVTQFIELMPEDTFGTFQTRTFAVNRTVKALVTGTAYGRNWFGAAVTFIAGDKSYNHAQPFDTIVDFNNPSSVTKGNSVFRILAYFDDSKYQEDPIAPKVVNDRIYNHGIVAEARQRYHIPFSGGTFADYFYPATYTASYMTPEIEFLVSSPNVGIDKISKAGDGLGEAYPNPAIGGTEVFIPFTVINDASVSFTVTDITGKVIETINAEYNSGSHAIAVDTKGMSKGIYIYTMKANGYSSSSKFIVE
ncbi:MAG: T9SS type A sorting domain-containing protein [Bacteroidia bacterium]|nr:T9SS type A sorting domain-containing protein [Bacteroidia bacterium]